MSLESQSVSAARAANARSALVRELAQKLRQTERSRQPDAASFADVDAFENQKRDACISTGIEPLNDLLPDGGFLKGTIVEWVCDEIGSGARTLALLSAASILQHRVNSETPRRKPNADSLIRNNLLVIDAAGDFYPVAAAGLGIDLQRTVVVRPGLNHASCGTGLPDNVVPKSRAARQNDVLWALEQALRSKAIGLTMCAIDHLNGHTFRRLQLAAEAGDGLCFLRRPLAAMRQPTWADVRLLVKSGRTASVANRATSNFRSDDAREGDSVCRPEIAGDHHADRDGYVEADGGSRRVREQTDEQRPTGADYHLRAEARISPPAAAVRRMTVELLKCRSGLTGGKVELDYHDETNDVRVAAELARPAATQRSARA